MTEPVERQPRHLRTNSLVNLTGFVLPIAVSLVTVPRYLTVVGQERYGVLVIVWIMLGYFGVFDLGLGRATTHQIARAGGDQPRVDAVFWTASALNAVVGLLGGLLLLPVAYGLVSGVFNFPHALEHEVVRALPWLALSVPMIVLSSVFTGALQGRERFISVNAIIAVNGVLFQVVPLIVAETHGPNLVWLIASTTIVQAATSVLGLLACLRWIASGRPRIDRRLISGLFAFGGWVSVSGLISPLLTILDRLVVGAAIGAGGVTRYSVPFNLVTRLWIIPNSVSRTIFPRIAMLPRNEAEEIAQESLHGLFLVLTPIVVVGLLLVEPFLHAWVGGKLGPDAPRVAALLLVGVWVNGLAYVPYTFLQAQGRPDVPAKLHLVELLPILLVLWLGLEVAGVAGGALAWSLRAVGDGALLAWTSRVPWRTRPSQIAGVLLLLLAFATAMLLNGQSAPRLSVDAVLLIATAAWTLRSLPFPVGRLPWRFGSNRPLPDAGDVARH